MSKRTIAGRLRLPSTFVCGLLLSCVSLSSCVNPVERERQRRAEHYNAVLAELKPGATRADLRRLFPAAVPTRPFNASSYSVIGAPPSSIPQPENYSLDAEFAVLVRYDYQRTPKEILPPKQPFASVTHLKQYGISSDTIDRLLFPSFRIYPQSRDRIVDFPLLVHRKWDFRRPQTGDPIVDLPSKLHSEEDFRINAQR